ncbi:hypothetical protein EON65_11985 [archaeon]|nr:MAG: hypothetical protein EON65_11985 [archaeon]
MSIISSSSFDPSKAVEISGALNVLKKHVVKSESDIDQLISAPDSPLYILRDEIMVKDKLCPVRRLCVKNVDLPGWVLNIDAKFCMECCSTFGISVWCHHCRKCGKAICQSCSKTVPDPSGLDPGGMRVCLRCYYNDITDIKGIDVKAVSKSKRRLSLEYITKRSGPEASDDESQKSETESMLMESHNILRTNLMEAEEQLNRAHSGIEYMQSELDESEVKLNTANEEAKELRVLVSTYEEKLRTCEEQLKTTIGENTTASEEIEELRLLMSSYEVRLKAASEQANALQQQLKTCEEQLKEATEEAKAGSVEAHKANEEAKELRLHVSSYEERLKAANEEAKELRSLVSAGEQQMKAATEDAKAADEEAKHLRTLVSTREEQLQAANEEVKAAHEQLTAVSKEARDAGKLLYAAKEEAKVALEEVSYVRHENVTLKLEVSSLAIEIHSLSFLNAKLKADLDLNSGWKLLASSGYTLGGIGSVLSMFSKYLHNCYVQLSCGLSTCALMHEAIIKLNAPSVLALSVNVAAMLANQEDLLRVLVTALEPLMDIIKKVQHPGDPALLPVGLFPARHPLKELDAVISREGSKDSPEFTSRSSACVEPHILDDLVPMLNLSVQQNQGGKMFINVYSSHKLSLVLGSNVPIEYKNMHFHSVCMDNAPYKVFIDERLHQFNDADFGLCKAAYVVICGQLRHYCLSNSALYTQVRDNNVFLLFSL